MGQLTLAIFLCIKTAIWSSCCPELVSSNFYMAGSVSRLTLINLKRERQFVICVYNVIFTIIYIFVLVA